MRNLILSIFLLLIVFLLGTLGYSLIEEWSYFDSFYMTLITITTIGFGEVHPLSPNGVKFTIVLIIVGLSVFTFTFRSLTILFLEGQFVQLGRKKRMEQQIKKLKNHYIICGYSKIGKQIAEEFELKKVPFIIIDKSFAEQSVAIPEYIVYLEGDATSEEILKEAGIEKAKGMITALPSDAENVFTTMTARGLNKDIIIFAQANEPQTEKKLFQAGASKVIFPHVIASRKVVSCILKPNVVDFIDIALGGTDLSLEIEELLVDQSSSLINKELKDSGIRDKFNIIVVAIKKNNNEIIFNPGPLSKINIGDTLIALGRKADLDALTKIARMNK
jgi:voltage-gated potassium channel